MQRAGALFLEAPFTGSKLAAEQRQTVYYLGGEPDVVEKARIILKSSAILHIGPLGSASSLKLAMNLNIAGIAQTLCESLTLCRADGIPNELFFSALARNVSHSGVSDLKEPKLCKRDYTPQFSLKNMSKYLRLALETAADLSVSLEQTEHLNKIGSSAESVDDFRFRQVAKCMIQGNLQRFHIPKTIRFSHSEFCFKVKSLNGTV